MKRGGDSGKRILIADDSPTVVEILTYLLGENDYEVVAAVDGVDALQRFYEDPPDLVVLDLEMPRMNGYQVCRALRDDPRVATVPIIILTSHDAQGDRFRGLSTGADVYLVKNLEDGRLLAEVRRLISKSPWLDKNPPQGEPLTPDDIIQRINSILDRQLFTTTVVNDLYRTTSDLVSLEATVQGILRQFASVFEFVIGGILVGVKDGQVGHIVIRKGYDAGLKPLFLKALSSAAADAGLSAGLDDRTPHSRLENDFPRPFPNTTELTDFHSWRLYSRGVAIGVIGIGATERLKFDREGKELLEQYLVHAGVILDNARLLHELQSANLALSKALEELKEAQSQLVQSEKLASLGQLTAGLVHEMNNPINFISGNVEHLDRNINGLLNLVSAYREAFSGSEPEELARLVQSLDLDFLNEDLPVMIGDMREGIERTQGIIRDLRTFSAKDRGVRTSTDLAEVVDSTLNILRYKWVDKIEVCREFEVLEPVECNAGQVGQVVMNLLSNAFDAVAERSSDATVTVRLKQQPPWAIIEVEDNGVGIEPENLKNLFQPFFTTKDIGSGMGLGLSISHSIVEAHHGNLEVDSRVGEGTRFVVKLPLTTEE